MATQLAVVPQAHPPAPVPTFTISEVERVALAIAKGNLFGTNDANAVLTLCLLAQAEGQHPATVFRDYHVIKGKPAKKADAMLRDFINSGGKVEWHQLDDKCADATFTHPAGKARIAWDMDRAKTAGLATDMWRKYPRQMLRSRVISEGIRTVYPGATSGLYVTEEVQDMTGGDAAVDDAEVVAPRETARDRAAREADANGGVHPNNMPEADEEPFDAAATALRIEGLLKTASTKAEIGQIWNKDSREDRARLKAADANLYAALSKKLEFETQRVAPPANPSPQHDAVLDDDVPF